MCNISKGDQGYPSDACRVWAEVEGGCPPQSWESQAGGDFFLGEVVGESRFRPWLSPPEACALCTVPGAVSPVQSLGVCSFMRGAYHKSNEAPCRRNLEGEPCRAEGRGGPCRLSVQS